MKPTFLLSSKAWMAFAIASVSAVILLSSCSKKNDPQPEPVGEARVKHVNCVEGSAAQDLYINDTKKTTTAVAYGSNSDYLVFTSGVNVFASMNTGTTTANATSQQVSVPIGAYITALYYKKSGGTLAMGLLGDDMTTVTGKAKVRFINLNGFLAANVAVGITGGVNLIPAVQYESFSDYIQVDPGTKFTFSAGAVTSASVDGALQAGKNYTIWIDGANATTLTGHVIVQN
ncbi:DUF4397 domain-containing protein [Pedobacter africanus]|uniref:DUF4397 domain-containing protein n=1 Tax=Pedobacter africanus TaxID=151894 RepID=A0A1W1ZNN1_9SPHI|nr:DUF4397 domain-containing protein [Pedobacter africanus]SMC49863.1 protein of unknown function [Pedobacter africanus]